MILAAGGYGFAKCDAAAIAYFWSNWDVYFRLNRHPFRVTKLTETSWLAKGFGGSGEWHLVNYQFDDAEGYFLMISCVSFAGTLSKGASVFRYRRLGDEYFYSGSGYGEVPHRIKLCGHSIKRLIERIAFQVSIAGGLSCERLYSGASDDRLLNTDRALYARYKSFARDGSRGGASNISVHEAIASDIKARLRTSLDDVHHRLVSGDASAGAFVADMVSFLTRVARSDDILSLYGGMCALLSKMRDREVLAGQPVWLSGGCGLAETFACVATMNGVLETRCLDAAHVLASTLSRKP